MTFRRRRIGLLGGSFNPAHEGHLHISLEALKRLKLDEVWWLVSPQNPLKAKGELADYATRLASAEGFARHPRLKVLTLEQDYGLYYTIDTIRFLKRRTRHDYVWLMGADNLLSFHRWRQWRAIASLVPIAVLDRAPYGLKALHGRFAESMKLYRLPGRLVASIASAITPAWCYLTIPRHPISASYLRNLLGSRAYMRHSDKR